MIPASLGSLIAIYLLGFLAAMMILWLSYGTRRTRRKARARKNLFRCSLCGLEFEDFTGEPLPICPRCGTVNERIPARFY